MTEYIVDIGFMSQPDLGVSIREEIVRCRDCKHYDNYLGSCIRRYTHFAAEHDGFCAWAERRDA